MVAVDPTSPYSGGAILGDRIRMRDHDADAGFYMRSMATRGSLGGLARASADVALVIEASGKQRLLVETVGVGQDEIDIVRLADITLVCAGARHGRRRTEHQGRHYGNCRYFCSQQERSRRRRPGGTRDAIDAVAGGTTRRLDTARGSNHRHQWRGHRRVGTCGAAILVVAGTGRKARSPARGALAERG